MGERRFESSRLVCPGIRFLPINWDWHSVSVAGSLAVVPVVPRKAFAACVGDHTCFFRLGKWRWSAAWGRVSGRRRRLSGGEVWARVLSGVVGR